MMEVDMHSPSTEKTQSMSSKRPHSPDPRFDHPTKRVSLVTGPHPSSFGQSSFRVTNSNWSVPSAGNGWHHSDDWVQRTDSLTIDGPTVLGTLPASQSEFDTLSEDNETVPSTIMMNTPATLRPSAHVPPVLHSIHAVRQQNEPQSRPPASQFIAQSNNQQQPFAFAFTPAKSLVFPTHSRTQHDLHSAQSQRAPSPDDMPVTPILPSSVSVSSTNSRRQRFTMGPRADCEKCRLGMKGHWVHFD